MMIKRLSILLLIVIFLLCGVKLVRVGVPLRSLYNTMTQVQSIRANPAALDVTTLQPLVHQTHLDLLAVQAEARPLIWVADRAGWLPKIGGDVQAAPELLAMGVSLTGAGDIMLSAVQPALAAAQTDSARTELVPLTLASLSQAEAQVEEARSLVEVARDTRRHVNVDRLSPPLAEPLRQLDQVLPLSDLAFELVQLLPDLLGFAQPRTYLILAQNNDELRPTGGFISAVGRVTFDKGKLVEFSFEDSYTLDDFSQPYPDAPPQLLRYMLSEILLVRDSNWSPDFPTSVETLLEVYAISRDVAVDGVIAVDQIALQQIVSALEPVHVEGWPEPATGETVIEQIRASWSPEDEAAGRSVDPVWWSNRKNFIGDLVGALRNRVETSPGSVKWSKTVEAVLTALGEKHIQVWLANPRAQGVMARQGWDGAVPPINSDFLMVVETNMGFNKANALVDTSIHYAVDLTTPAAPEATVTVSHQNNSPGDNPCRHNPRYGGDYWDLMHRCYWNYLRVYAPQGSELLAATPHPLSGEFLLSQQDEPARYDTLTDAGDKTGWGTFLMVPRAGRLETTFQYALPEETLKLTDSGSHFESGYHYRLDLVKQAGVLQNHVTVALQLPPGSRLLSAHPTPTPSTTQDSLIEFDLALRRNTTLEVTFEAAPTE